MRLVLALLLLAPAASAQPLAASPASPVSWSLTTPDDRSASDVVSAIAVGTGGAIIGAGAGALGALFVAVSADDCRRIGCDGPTFYVVALSAGGMVGSAVLVEMVARDLGWGRFWHVDTGLRPGDGWRALAGAAIGTVPGLLTVALIGPTEGGGEWIAVPIAQGLGTGIALSF